MAFDSVRFKRMEKYDTISLLVFLMRTKNVSKLEKNEDSKKSDKMQISRTALRKPWDSRQIKMSSMLSELRNNHW